MRCARRASISHEGVTGVLSAAGSGEQIGWGMRFACSLSAEVTHYQSAIDRQALAQLSWRLN